jgi:5-formyltetrahydrofolate cyclo-ligase
MEQEDDSRIARDPAVADARAALRASLLAARRQPSSSGRRAENEALVARLDGWLGDPSGEVVAVYWPVRGEPSLEPLPGRWVQAGARLALPVVVARDAPLRFVAWTPGDPTERGAFGIREPVSAAAVRPTVLVLPCLGFDPRGWRLGYGGGYYDRSLAALSVDGGPAPRVVGVAWDEARLERLETLPTDRPLDAVITPSRLFLRGGPSAR